MHVAVKFTQLKAFHPYQPSSHSCSKVGIRSCDCKWSYHVAYTKKCDHIGKRISTLKSEVLVTMAPLF